MVKRLNIDNVDVKTQEFLKGMSVSGERYLVELEGKPLIGIVAPEEMERAERFEVFDRVWAKNKNADEAETDQDIAEAIEHVRKHP